jgi:DNA-binding transcriptional regulator YhcF (GntR family)
MVITIDQALETPVYRQLERQLVAAVASGELAKGEKLPSVRSLAQDLGINLHTVNKAYAKLVEDGLFVSLGSKGTFVAGAELPADRTTGIRSVLSSEIAALAARWIALGGSKDSFVKLCDDAVASL